MNTGCLQTLGMLIFALPMFIVPADVAPPPEGLALFGAGTLLALGCCIAVIVLIAGAVIVGIKKKARAKDGSGNEPPAA